MKSPTRFRADQNPSLLDLITTSEPDAFQNIITHDPLGKCNQCTLYFGIITQKQNQDNLNKKYDYDKLNCEIFMSTMEAENWDDIFSESVLNEFSDAKNEAIHSVFFFSFLKLFDLPLGIFE